MTFNIKEIKTFYSDLNNKINKVREVVGRPLTLTEKILFSHSTKIKDFVRAIDYANFSPDRVAMQDATAQMALLQFMMAGKNKVAVPSTVHADHLIQAKFRMV